MRPVSLACCLALSPGNTATPAPETTTAEPANQRAVIGWGSALLSVGGLAIFTSVVPMPVLNARWCAGSEAPPEFCAPKWKWSDASSITLVAGTAVALAGGLVLAFGLRRARPRRSSFRFAPAGGGLRILF